MKKGTKEILIALILITLSIIGFLIMDYIMEERRFAERKAEKKRLWELFSKENRIIENLLFEAISIRLHSVDEDKDIFNIILSNNTQLGKIRYISYDLQFYNDFGSQILPYAIDAFYEAHSLEDVINEADSIAVYIKRSVVDQQSYRYLRRYGTNVTMSFRITKVQFTTGYSLPRTSTNEDDMNETILNHIMKDRKDLERSIITKE